MDKKISQLTTASTPLAGTEILPIVQSSVTKKATVQDVLGYVVNDSTNSVLKTVYSASDIGLKLDFANNSYVLGGINDGYNVRVTGFDPNGGVDIGDYNLYASGTQINLRQELIKTQFNGNDTGLFIDFANGYYNFGLGGGTATGGDGSGLWQGLNITNDVFEGSLGYRNVGIDGIGFLYQIYPTANTYLMKMGDYSSINNGTCLTIDDQNQRWEMSNNLTEATAGASASKFLKVYINGVTYKIALLNNA